MMLMTKNSETFAKFQNSVYGTGNPLVHCVAWEDLDLKPCRDLKSGLNVDTSGEVIDETHQRSAICIVE